jgi:hypothetical protein
MDTLEIIAIIQSILTLFAILVALFGRELLNWYRRPKLVLQFEYNKPFLKFAELDRPKPLWFRQLFGVENTRFSTYRI